MYRLVALIVMCVALQAVPPLAFAQRGFDPEAVMRRWAASQVEAGRQIERIAFEERTVRKLDGHFGTRTMHIHARLEGAPYRNSWQRDVLAAFINGRELSRAEYERLARASGHLDESLEAIILPSTLLTRMQPIGRAVRVPLRRGSAWQFDVVPPPQARTLIRRVTVWVNAERADLLQTRAVFQRPGRGAPLLITTTYENMEGMDLPRSRSIEGTIQTRRRLRTFTIPLRVDSEYTDYRIARP